MKERLSGIQSLDRGLQALDLVAQYELRPSKLAAALDVSRPTALRLLQTLVNCGYVLQDPQTKAFRANPAKLFALANMVRSSSTWLTEADDLIADLARLTGETANLAVLQGTEMVYVAAAQSNEALAVRQLLGWRRPLHCSAIGKAILAYMDRDQRAALLARAGLARHTSHTITSLEVLESQLEQIRQNGWALDEEETVEGVRCVAAPVLGVQAIPRAAIGISAPVARLTDEKLPFISEQVKQTSRRLAQRLWDM
ncbi:MAG: IclR family transcriptional regulator [Planctomycetaceae bacterium]|nr:MAG: IclR family transcriptional regulator [Planctomycetaceae bacterium]